MYVKPLRSVRGKHQGKACLVVGTGPSAWEVPIPAQGYSIGVNGVGAFFLPMYLLVSDYLDTTGQHGERAQAICSTPCECAFTPTQQQFDQAETVRYSMLPLHRMDPSTILAHDALWSSMTSTETAIGLAVYMGFTSIGVIGWDLKDHPCEEHLDRINRDMAVVALYGEQAGIKLWNVSPQSLITAFPYLDFFQFLECTYVNRRIKSSPFRNGGNCHKAR
jgi:hypothetical protein